jgi:hypothetical protein
LILKNRIFETKDLKKLWVFASNLETFEEMITNTMVNYHANQVIKILDKIVILLTTSSINEKDKEKLIDLGKRHYHFGLKKEHFKVVII